MDERIAADISATGRPGANAEKDIPVPSTQAAPANAPEALAQKHLNRRGEIEGARHKARHAISVNSPLPQPVEFDINDALGITPETSLYPRRHPIDLGPMRLAALIADDGRRQLRFA